MQTSQTCYAFKKDRIANLPVKNKMAARRTRYFNYLIIKNGEQLLLQQRTAKDIWQQLYEFPLVETTEPADWKSLNKELSDTKNLHLKSTVGPVKHVLSHQDILATFYVIETKGKLPTWQNAFAANAADLDNYGLPRVITLFLEKNTVI
jgi:A/G-specific adenine glycosylase